MSNYISGSYGLKYYAEWRNQRGQDFRLEVKRRGFSGTAKIMGDFHGAALEIQGDQGNVTAPIVKTQFRFQLIDSWDTPDTTTTKYGGWEEFYTPDSTLYLVVLKSWTGSAWTARWSGYITPDSWSESLDYKGAITVTARDNIGHLQDFPFDLTGDAWGLVSLRSIITGAAAKVNLPLDLQFENLNLPAIDGDGTALLDAKVCVSTFEGDNWERVLEDVLDSIGYTLRWTDNNRITVCAIRHLPLVGNDGAGAPPTNAVEFYGGSRRLDPAFKQIVDTMQYDGDNSADLDVKAGLSFSGTRQDYTIQYQYTGVVAFDTGWSYQNAGASDGYGWQAGYGFLSGDDTELSVGMLQEEGEDAATIGAILCANKSDAGFMQTYKARVISPAATLRIDFAALVRGLRPTGETDNMMAPLHVALSAVRVYIRYEVGNNERFWNGSAWVSSAVYIDRTLDETEGQSGYSLEFALGPCDLADGGDLYIVFDRITSGPLTVDDTPARGIYARILGMSLSSNAPRLESDKVTMVNDSDFNVTMDRKPVVGALSRAVPVVSPANYPNALFHVKYGVLMAFPYGVSWGQGTATKPLPVMIHQQILMFHHLTLSVLDGDCAPVNKAMPGFDAIWTYKGRSFILQSGTWDLGSGVIQGAVLREYVEYDDLWDDTSSSWDGDNQSKYDTDAYKDRQTSQPSSSGGGGGGGGTGTVTSIGLSMPTGFSVSPGAAITTSGTFQVAFASGYSLPKTTDVSKGVAAYGAMTDMATDIQQAKTDIEDLDDRVTAIEQGGGGGGSVVSWGSQGAQSNTIQLTVNNVTKTLVQQAGYDNLDDRVTALENASPGTGGVSSIRVKNSSGTDGTYTPVNGVVTLPNYPTMLRNPNSLILSKTQNGTVIKEYNGEQGVTFTAADLEAALDGIFATLSMLEDYVDSDTLENILLGYVSTGSDVQTVQGFKKFIGGLGFASGATANSGLRMKVVNSTINGVTKSRIHIYGDVVVHGEMASGDSSNNND